MHKSIVVGLAILAASTVAASATGTHRNHHRRAMNPNASAAAMNRNEAAMNRNPYARPNPYTRPGSAHGVAMNSGPYAGSNNSYAAMRSKDYDMYMKNLQDSGYNPKSDFDKAGNMREH